MAGFVGGADVVESDDLRLIPARTAASAMRFWMSTWFPLMVMTTASWPLSTSTSSSTSNASETKASFGYFDFDLDDLRFRIVMSKPLSLRAL